MRHQLHLVTTAKHQRSNTELVGTTYQDHPYRRRRPGRQLVAQILPEAKARVGEQMQRGNERVMLAEVVVMKR